MKLLIDCWYMKALNYIRINFPLTTSQRQNIGKVPPKENILLKTNQPKINQHSHIFTSPSSLFGLTFSDWLTGLLNMLGW